MLWEAFVVGIIVVGIIVMGIAGVGTIGVGTIGVAMYKYASCFDYLLSRCAIITWIKGQYLCHVDYMGLKVLYHARTQ